jgi:hypothetical protein
MGLLSAGAKGGKKAVKGLLDQPIKPTQERMRDAGLMSFDDDAFHGSTYNIEDFSLAQTLNPEGHFGASHYFTSSADDASRHYAGMGPDLTSRIEQRMDELDSMLDGYEIDDLLESYPEMSKKEAEKIASGNSEVFDNFKRRVATKELAGDNLGSMYPVKLKTGKTYDLGTNDDTFMRYERDLPDRDDLADEIRDEIDRADYEDDDAFEDAIEELVDERYHDAMSYEDPQGELVDFISSLQRQADDYGFESDELIENIVMTAQDFDGITATKLDDIMRSTQWYADDDMGRLINNEVYRQAVEDAGFDSIKHKGDIFRGMEVDPDTIHTIVFDPKNIRSKYAQFDPTKQASSSILASRFLPTTGSGLLAMYALSPDDARAAQIAATDTRDVGSIQAARNPRLQRAAGLLGSIDTPIGSLFESTPNVLNRWAYGEEADAMDKLGMALELMP